MDAAMQQHLSVAAVVMSAAALCFSLMAAFPGLKGVLSAVRDGVLWFALLLLAGGLGLVVWQQRSSPPGATAAVHSGSPGRELTQRLQLPLPARSGDAPPAPDPRAAVSP